ncbi:MAG TPA: methyltransferase [Candidatus Limnocylindria bacterium]|nr:methyltransferase [Candidatus Limnocylindria bacterium]
MTGPLALDRPELVRRLREVLIAREFSAAKIGDALGTGDEIVSRTAEIPVQLRQLERHPTLGALVRLLILALDVPADQLAPAIAPLALSDLASLGLVAQRDVMVRPLVRVVPHDHLLITSDIRLRPGEAAPADHVPGVHRPSVTLAHLTVRRPVRAFLDLGTGCGVEALLASPHAERVLATDVSARAVNFAAFNAQLNGVANLELRVGSWFEPIGDARFDTIVCNPPYVISPASEYIYRDSGMSGDSVSEQIVRSIPAHLEEGGFATMAISWVAEPDGDPTAAVRRWVRDSGCDSWLLHYRTDSPLETAAVWNQTESGDPERYGRLIDTWLAYYRDLGIRGIAYGSLVMRRRSGANWFRSDPLPGGGRLKPSSDHIQRVFAAHDLLAAGPEVLLGERVRVVPRAAIEQRVRFSDGQPQIDAMTLTLDEGVGFQAGMDDQVLHLLTQLDGRRTLREALAEGAKRDGVADVERYASAGLPAARRMFELGFLERVVQRD